MNLKTGFYILCCTFCLSLLASCLGGSDTEEYIVSTDAEILSFKLSHDSISALNSVVFSIDQINGLIYNHDSMAYGTDIYEKVVVTYTSAAGYANVLNVTNAAAGDTAWIQPTTDSLDVSKPVRLKVYAPDGVTIKYYWMNLNIHQINPDSVQYTQIAANQSFLDADEVKAILLQGTYFTYSRKASAVSLSRSVNAKDWTPATLTGLSGKTKVREIQQGSKGLYACTDDGELYFSSNAVAWQKIPAEYPVKTVLGYLNASPTQVEGLALIVQKDSELAYAFTHDLSSFTYGYEVPADFPVTDFSSVSLVSMQKQNVTVIGGTSTSGTIQNTVWSTQNGLYWAKLTDAKQGFFPMMKGANAFLYGGGIYILNGQFPDGSYNKEVYCSVDGGVTWSLKPETYFFPEGYVNRYGASLVSDAGGIDFYILGGKNETILTDIWQGFLNKMTFK